MDELYIHMLIIIISLLAFILGIKLILIRIKNYKTDKKLHGLERSIKGLDNMRTDGLALVLILGGGANFLFYTNKVFIIILELFY